MKTNGELLKMSMNELRMYCSSLKYYTIDKHNYQVLTVQDISLIRLECFLVNDNIHLKYYLKNDFINNTYYSILNNILEYANKYAGIFENKEDAVNATKQHVKQQKLNKIEEHKQSIKTLEEEINKL